VNRRTRGPRTTRALRACLAIAAVVLALPTSASAHAVLERTVPAQGQTVPAQPGQVAFYFSEPVEASFGAVRVFDSDGDQLDTGELIRPEDRSDAVGAELPDGLADGTYTATYRVVSADSHPVSGGFVFSIGSAGSGSGETVAELLDETESGAALDIAFWADRFAGYLALGIGIGALLFLVAVWAPARAGAAGGDPAWSAAAETFAGRWCALALGAALVGLVASLLALPLQAANVSGNSFWSSLDPDVLSEVVDTRYGTVLALRAGAWLLLAGIVVLAARRLTASGPPAWIIAAAAVPVGFLVISPALAGHASTQDPRAVIFGADVIHVAAMTAWLGGLVAVLAALPAATRLLDPPKRTELLVAALRRFSPIALASVIALAASGTVQAVIEVGSFEALVETGFGRAVVAKASLLAVLTALGYRNRSRFIPALGHLAGSGQPPGAEGRGLRANLRLEVGLIAAVLGIVAVLVSYAPPDETNPGPASGTVELGEQVLDYTVDPARVGRNQMHLYLFDAEDGSQFDGAREITATATLSSKEIGPLPVSLRKAGPGHYVAPDLQFGAAGDWLVVVEVRTSRFDQDEGRLEVDVR
jgi:copper transport protein